MLDLQLIFKKKKSKFKYSTVVMEGYELVTSILIRQCCMGRLGGRKPSQDETI
jgi:hypothetical protein